jgi:predicted alpha/beta-fold hydrolase
MEIAEIESIASHAAEFQPRRFIINGHLQTIMGNYLPRLNGLSTPEATLVEVSPATPVQIASQVLCHCHWQPEEVRSTRPTAILVHGLEGSSNSQYVVGNSNKLWRAGCNIIRMNMRNCGGTEALSPTLYHSGLSNDVLKVMNFFVAQHGLQSMSLIGYSMGGNLVLKLAGELGNSAPPELRSVIGVSPALDLGASADALHRPQNRVYELKFLRALLMRYRRKVALFPHVYDPNLATGIRSLRELDDRITALYSGFTGSDDYYYRAAAARVIDHIAVPTLILHALDDPFVRITEESCNRLKANQNIRLITTHHGGHCAFLAQPDADTGYDGYWAEHTLLRFLLANASVSLPTSALR